MDEIINGFQSLLPTLGTGGGLFGIYVYFRKVDAAIKEDLRKTITAQAEEIERLWAECRRLRGDRSGKHAEEGDDA